MSALRFTAIIISDSTVAALSGKLAYIQQLHLHSRNLSVETYSIIGERVFVLRNCQLAHVLLLRTVAFLRE